MMNAGRELDKLIAEHVMGLSLTMSAGPDHPGIKEGVTLYITPPRYSTKIEAAWLVVERMTNDDSPINDKKYSFGLEYSSVVDWVADFTPRRNHPQAREYESFRVEANTAPLAVCRAALAALGVPS